MVGFSNGALAIAVLVSSHDEFILSHFRNFCLVDHGMFHLTDLHKSGSINSRYLILVGDQQDYGRELKLRGAQLQQDSWRMFNIDNTTLIMENTGHDFSENYMRLVGDRLNGETVER